MSGRRGAHWPLPISHRRLSEMQGSPELAAAFSARGEPV